MKWFEYLRRTSWAQFRADLSEYMDLRRKCADLADVCENAYGRLVTTVSDEIKKGKPVPSCIYLRHYFLGPWRMSDDMMNNSMIVEHYYLCRNFNTKDINAKCDKVDCPFAERNHKYADACAQYDAMRRAKADFWHQKFAQAHQNVK